jgi:glycosyltransferase involved in cell wall biosynthesis
MTAICVFSHGHPFYSKGGGEIVAFNSFRAMRSSNLDAYLYCAVNQALKPNFNIFTRGEHLLEYRAREYLFPARKLDPFLFSHDDRAFFPTLIQHLTAQKIDVFHFHHFWSVGTDLIIQLMECFPAAKFILTLHELLAICLHDGQMVRTKTKELCFQQSDIECHMCFPQFDKDQFRARRLFLSEFLTRFDVLISPSAFVAKRINEWGVAKKIHVIENGFPLRVTPQIDTDDEILSKRFAFFGQPTPFKGLDIFVSAASQVERSDVTFAIYGSDRTKFVEQFGPQWDDVIDSMAGRLQFLGPYDPRSVCQLMQQNGWIVVPSIWWENSPLVIQEAFLADRPPIVGDIGGMSEKVEDGVTGLHFNARNAASLARVMAKAAGNVDLWRRLRFQISQPPTIEEMNDSLINLYATIQK